MQYPKNNARRVPDYQNNIHTAARSERCGNSYRNCNAPAQMPPMCPMEEDRTQMLPTMPQSLAMAYIPFQEFRELYEPENALCAGTLFRELEKPFYGQRRRMG